MSSPLSRCVTSLKQNDPKTILTKPCFLSGHQIQRTLSPSGLSLSDPLTASFCRALLRSTLAPLPRARLVRALDAVEQGCDDADESDRTVTRVFCPECGSALAHKSAAFEPAMAVQTVSKSSGLTFDSKCSLSREQGNLANFPQKAPIAAELFVKDRWAGCRLVSPSCAG